MATVLVSELVTRVRQTADLENDDSVSDTEIINYLNEARSELADILTVSYGDHYFASSVTFSGTANVTNYSLSTLTGGTFNKATGMDQITTPATLTMQLYNFPERNLYANVRSIAWYPPNSKSNYRYAVIGDDLSILPAPTGSETFKLYFSPIQNKFVTSTDTYDVHNYWDEFLTLGASISAKDKHDNDVSVLMVRKAACKQRIENAAPNRGSYSEPYSMVGAEDFHRGVYWPWRY